MGKFNKNNNNTISKQLLPVRQLLKAIKMSEKLNKKSNNDCLFHRETLVKVLSAFPGTIYKMDAADYSPEHRNAFCFTPNDTVLYFIEQKDCFDFMDFAVAFYRKYVSLRTNTFVSVVHVCQRSKCKKDYELKLCSSCKEVYYCSSDCQKEHWKFHKDICRLAIKSIR